MKVRDLITRGSHRQYKRYDEKCFGSSWIAGEAMKKYAVVVESGPNNFSAYVPDLPGCIATGKTIGGRFPQHS